MTLMKGRAHAAVCARSVSLLSPSHAWAVPPALCSQEARRYLDRAIQFTPQYGDSFIELARLELMTQGPDADTDTLRTVCAHARTPMLPLLLALCPSLHPAPAARLPSRWHPAYSSIDRS